MRATHIFAATITGMMFFGAGLAQGQGKLQKLEDKLGAPPAASGAPAAPGSGYLGGEFDDPRAGQKGVLVNAVRPNAPAEKGGLKANDLITAIDGKPVAGLNDLDAVLDKAIVGQKLRMAVNRAGRTVNVEVELGVRPAAPSPAELNPGEAPPPSSPGTAAPGAATPGAVTPPATRSPTLTDLSPALGSPAPATTPPATTPPGPPGAFSPRPALTPPTDSGTLLPPASGSPGGAIGSGIRAQPLDPGSRPAITDRSDVPPIPPAVEPTPGPATETPSPAAGGGPSLGITVDELTDEARASYGLTVRRGALITHVRAGTPADRSGLPVGGVVVTLDGRRIDSASDLVSAISAAQPGQEIELGYYEGNRFGRKSIKLAPSTATAAPGSVPRASSGMPRERSMLGQVERRVDNFARAAVSGPSTIYDPTVVAGLQAQVAELTATVKSLEERLRALEGNRGTGPATTATPAPAITPGFGSAPIGPATPGFVPGLAPPGTNP